MYGRHFLKTMLAAASIAAVAVSSAFAADLNGAPPYSSIKDEPIYAPAFSWTGVYVGAQGGYMWGKADHSYSSDWGPSGSSDSNGWIGGVHTGYNMQSGNVVYGIEADVEGGNVSGSFTNLTSSGSVDLNWQGSVRARLGYVTGKALLYVTGGWAFGDFDFNGRAGGFASGYSETLHGWTIGAGGEFAMSNNMTMRLEYRYTDFGNASGNLAPTLRMPVDLDAHAIRAGISYKF
jgi:outer membrane immunogenic protein